MVKKNKEKKVVRLKDWIKKIYIDISIANIIDLLILYVLFFWIVGQSANTDQTMIWLYLLLVIPFSSAKQVAGKTLDGRLAFIRDKWILDEGEKINTPQKIRSPWHKLGLLAFLSGLGIGLVFCIIIKFGFSGYPTMFDGAFAPFTLVTGLFSIIGMSIITLLFSNKLIYKDLSSFANEILNSEKKKSKSIWRLYLLEYVIPWIILIGFINLVIQYKATTELALINGGLVPITSIASTMFINALVFIIWMPLTCSTQIRPDVHLGKIKQGKKISIWIILVIIIIIPIISGGIGYGILFIGNINYLSVPFATLINILSAVIPGIIGCGIGILFGRQKEFKLIEEKD